MVATPRLTDAQVRELRERHPYELPRSWVTALARDRGWRDANVIYLEGERKRSAATMRHLMSEPGVKRVHSTEEARDFIELAFEVFAPDDGFSGTLERRRDGTLRVEVADCPIYEALEAAHWLTVTACPSWHRRRGWLDALGVRATGTVLGKKKWGDPACLTVIDIRRVL